MWSDWCLYPQDKLKLWYDTFTDLSLPAPVVAPSESVVATGPVAFKEKSDIPDKKQETKISTYDAQVNSDKKHNNNNNNNKTKTENNSHAQGETVVIDDDDIDGEPMDDSDVVHVKAKSKWDVDDDLDGVPITDDDLDGEPVDDEVQWKMVICTEV